MKKWIKNHPDIWEFILFNILANCATVTNFIIMWLCTGFIFKGLSNKPFKLLVFDYSTQESLMLCGFLSFLIATTAAQIVNYIVQKKFVFKSSAAFSSAVPKYIVMVLVLVTVSAALPGYSQRFFIHLGLPASLAPTLANVVNIAVQVLISYPSMKFWILPPNKELKKQQEIS
ncbi:GtrA family protein [Blautia schinkii]|nr:GtrA family protein [Blautia schinkii]